MRAHGYYCALLVKYLQVFQVPKTRDRESNRVQDTLELCYT